MTIVVNIFGGPGSGKSTLAASVFNRLKQKSISTELVTEFAKDLVWDGNDVALSNQIYVFGNQHHMIYRMMGKVDVIVTDSPILLSVVYDKNKIKILSDLVKSEFKKLNSLNYYVVRDVLYDNVGRVHDEDDSKNLDKSIVNLLKSECINYKEVYPSDVYSYNIVSDVLKKLGCQFS